MKITDFIGERVEYDPSGQQIFGRIGDDIQLLADLRGWGAIQNLFREKAGQINITKASEFQDNLGSWIASAINEKLERERAKEQFPDITVSFELSSEPVKPFTFGSEEATGGKV